MADLTLDFEKIGMADIARVGRKKPRSGNVQGLKPHGVSESDTRLRPRCPCASRRHVVGGR